MSLRKLSDLKYFMCPFSDYDLPFCGNVKRYFIPQNTGEPSILKLDGNISQKPLYSDSDALCNYELKFPQKASKLDKVKL